MQKPFVLPVQTALGKYIYEVNRNEIIKVNEELFNYIKAIVETDAPQSVKASEEIKMQFVELQDCGYLSAKRVERIEHPATSQVENYLNRGMQKLTLQVTQNCNLRCKYCIYSENSNLNQRSHSSSVMSFETAKRAIDFYRRHSVDMDSATIGFYGGEPMLEIYLIKKVVTYAEKVFSGRKIYFGMTTNATLMTDEAFDFLLAHNFKLTFSVDGPKNTHDKNRVFANGTGSYDRMMTNINNAYKKDPNSLKDTIINMVIEGSQNYSELLSMFDEPSFQNVTVRHSFVENDGIAQQPSSEYLEQYNYDRFLALVNYLRNPNKRKYANKLIEQSSQSFSVNVENFSTQILHSTATPNGACIPGKTRLLVNCFGDFYLCEKVNESEAMKIGSLDEGFDYEKIKSVLNVGQLDATKCMNCWAITLCRVCARAADDGSKLSKERRNSTCKYFLSGAYEKIRERILAFENQQHKRDVMHWLEVKTL